MIDQRDRQFLERCIELAAEALAAGDQPFGSVLVDREGLVLCEAKNQVVSVDRTRHPEFQLARWAAAELTPGARADATVYTSGEHCAMCAAAHAYAGLGRIVYATSSPQLSNWQLELGVPSGRVTSLRIHDIAPDLEVEGPVPELAESVFKLHQRFHERARD